MAGVKDKLYYWAVDRNPEISKYYHAYVDANEEKHRKNPFASYWYLLQLNFIFRLLRWRSFALAPKKELAKKKASAKKKAPSKKAPPPKKAPSAPNPYLAGAESRLQPRRQPILTAHVYRDYDLISFDVFDTLVLRPLSTPTDLFYIVGEKLHILRFREIRIFAEREARGIAYAKYGHSEVTIYDIYERVAAMTGIDPEAGVKAEFETELDLCYANPFLRDIVKSFRADGKRMVVVSDMYLPKKFMVRLLEKCGYHDFDDVIVSCDHNCGKRGGALFHILKCKYPDAEKIVHFGDNLEADCQGAEAEGITPHYYRSVHSRGAGYRPERMSQLIGSAYRGIVNAHLHNGKYQYSIPYEFGFIYGGFYLLGYCCWIHEYCVRNKIEKLLFLSRDGEITRKVFQMLYDDIPTEYCYWSRNATVRYSMDCGLRYYAITRTVYEWTKNIANAATTVRQMFEQLKLSQSAYRYLADYRIGEDDTVVSRRENLRRFFFEHAEELSSVYTEEAEALEGYVAQVIGDSKRLALVDVGISGGSPFGLKRFIEKRLKPDAKISVLLSVYAESLDPWNLQDGELNAYICSWEQNREILEEYKSQKSFPYTCFETFHEALHPSFHHFEIHDGEPEFSFASLEFENYPMTRELQKGIMDFCRIYREAFRNYPYMFNISSADAIAPYRLMMPHVTAFMAKYFPDYVRTHYTPLNHAAGPVRFRDLLKRSGVI